MTYTESMTPEEWAHDVFRKWERETLITLADGPIKEEDIVALKKEIAEAIRVAVRAEREACARIAREIAVKWMTGPKTGGYGLRAQTADDVNVAILARGKK